MIAFSQQTRPSYGQGFARSAGQSAYPGLWKGLVGAWVPAIGVTGNTLFDMSGNRRNGVITGALWKPTTEGYALDFNGTSDDVSIDHHADLTFTNDDPFSISVWFRTTGTSNEILVSKLSSLVGYELVVATFGQLRVHLIGSWSADRIQKQTDAGYDDGEWHHGVLTYDGSSTAAGTLLYVDGSLQADSTTVDALSLTLASSGQLRLSERGDGGSNGDVDIFSVSIYRRVLTPNQIRTLYEVPLAPFRLRMNPALLSVPAAGGTLLEHPGWSGGMQEMVGGMAG